MANPFDKHRQEAPTQLLDLRAWCDDNNHRKLAERMGRWYYVHKVDDTDEVAILEGVDGTNARLLAQGKTFPDFHGWPEARMNGYRRWIWNCVQAGQLRVEQAA